MNTIFVQLLRTELGNIARNPNLYGMVLSAQSVVRIRDDIISVANSCAAEEPQISQQLLRLKDILFPNNPFGQGMVNPIALGEVIFGLDYLLGKQQSRGSEQEQASDLWAYIHPLIQKSSKKLYADGHYANAAEDAFIELNSRAKAIYKKLVQSPTTIPDGVDLMHKLFSGTPPLCPVCDTSTSSGDNYQQGFHFMAAGAMSALRNPKAHSNDEVLTAEEAMRRLMFASMLMYRLDEANLEIFELICVQEKPSN